MNAYDRIHPADLFGGKQPAELCILDVRTTAEAAREALPGCITIPLHELTPEHLTAELESRNQSEGTIYLLCRSGRRAETALKKLSGRINRPLCIIEGGLNAIKQVGIPVEKTDAGVVSLERQVRIAAGMLIMLFIILGFFVGSFFFILAGCIGAGLVFAGVTDTCGMALVLARMPWNRAQ